jgi:hypothetical protein
MHEEFALKLGKNAHTHTVIHSSYKLKCLTVGYLDALAIGICGGSVVGSGEKNAARQAEGAGMGVSAFPGWV